MNPTDRKILKKALASLPSSRRASIAQILLSDSEPSSENQNKPESYYGLEPKGVQASGSPRVNYVGEIRKSTLAGVYGISSFEDGSLPWEAELSNVDFNFSNIEQGGLDYPGLRKVIVVGDAKGVRIDPFFPFSDEGVSFYPAGGMTLDQAKVEVSKAVKELLSGESPSRKWRLM